MELGELWDPQPGYLDTASYGLPPRPVIDAMERMINDWRAGRTSFEPWQLATANARSAFARLVHVAVADVAVGATVSAQLGVIASALPDDANVVVPDCEFTSNLFPWLVQAQRGVTVTAVPLDRLADSIDNRTTLVSFSLVQSASGE